MPDVNVVGAQQVQQVVLETIDEVNQGRPDDSQLERSSQTQLFGQHGQLDSLGLVSLIVALEQRIAEEFGVAIALADEKALSRKTSPFRSVASLTEYVSELLEHTRRD